MLMITEIKGSDLPLEANMKRKTYRNFMIIANKLQREKGYNQQEAFDLSHKVFENVENDGAGRPAEFFYGMIVSKNDFEEARR